jgi:hypothetical protein
MVCCCFLLLQLVFALISPGRVVPNLVAGAIAEAGAQQAGDMMQVGGVGCSGVGRGKGRGGGKGEGREHNKQET